MEVKKEIQENINKYKRLEIAFREKPSLSFALSLIDLLMTGVFGIYYSKSLEFFFINYAAKNKKIRNDYKEIIPTEKTYLHVVSKVYLSGGHTRIVERWIDTCDNSEKHSVVLLNQTNLKRIPNKLREVVSSKNGEFIIFNSSQNIIEKSNKLRDLAFEYDTIILHHHPNDSVPLMAFSVEEFNRPLVCFNHSGHTYWLGSEVVDYCIDIERNQNICTIQKRGIKNTSIIDMPVDSYENTGEDKTNIRKILGITKDSLLLLSMASMYKYTPMKELDFTKTVRSILEKNEKSVFVGIGITNTTEIWKKLVLDFNGRVFLLGHIGYDDISKYLKETDLYIDSFPYNSWLSLIDAINIGNSPCLVLKTPVGYPNFMEGSSALCNTIDELIDKASLILKDKEKRKELSIELSNSFKQKCSKEYFKKEIEYIITITRKLKKGASNQNKKEVHDIMPFDEYSYFFKTAPDIKEKGIKNIFQIIRINSGVSKINEIVVFGFKIFKFENNKLVNLLKKHKVT